MTNTRWSTFTGKDVLAATSGEAIEKAGLNWQVEQSPVYFGEGRMETAEGYRVNYRSDTQKPLGIVTDSYRVLQNSQAFQFLDSLVGSQEMMFVNAGSFKDGAKVYIQAKLPGFIRFNGGDDDRGEKLLTFITSHDGSLAISTMFTPVRIVCQNTLIMSLRKCSHKTSIKHTLNMANGLREARETLGILNNQFTLLEDLSRKMSSVTVNASNMPEILEKVGLVPHETDRSTRAKNIIDEVLHRFHYGQGANLPGSKGTAWGAYNAVTEYVDHFRGSNGVKRAESAIVGSGALVKEKALELLSA